MILQYSTVRRIGAFWPLRWFVVRGHRGEDDAAGYWVPTPLVQWPGILVTCLASRGKLIRMRLVITSIDSKKKIESRNYDFILFSIFELITK
jgi:hypothetical protein